VKNSREAGRQENNEQFNRPDFISTFAVAGCGECDFIRLAQIGRNHFGDDILATSG
jgi:hypothetical protein